MATYDELMRRAKATAAAPSVMPKGSAQTKALAATRIKGSVRGDITPASRGPRDNALIPSTSGKQLQDRKRQTRKLGRY